MTHDGRSLASASSVDSLDIPSSLAARIFNTYSVRPEFLRALLFFGQVPLESETRNSYISYHGGEDDECREPWPFVTES